MLSVNINYLHFVPITCVCVCECVNTVWIMRTSMLIVVVIHINKSRLLSIGNRWKISTWIICESLLNEFSDKVKKSTGIAQGFAVL